MLAVSSRFRRLIFAHFHVVFHIWLWKSNFDKSMPSKILQNVDTENFVRNVKICRFSHMRRQKISLTQNVVVLSGKAQEGAQTGVFCPRTDSFYSFCTNLIFW